MKGIIKLLILPLAFGSQAVFAMCTQHANLLTGWVGLDSPNKTVYADVTSLSNECSCDHARFTESNTDANMALTVLLAAKASGKGVRIDFIDAENCSSAYRVYLEE
ncbi:hypothetical protein ACJJIF_05485 [Microbulbifer sp. SSSA002]|uniref:hypothetical protein n=1 Tax=unclassified Microbulbifer TaxID=2619833 RepID=UPI0040392D88